MNNRIALVLKTKNISPSQLADDLGVQRSGISHIINGRNKPSLEFVQKLIKLYPDISMNWILFGEGPMMNPYPAQAFVSIGEKTADLFPEEKPKPRIMELFSTVDDPILEDDVPEEETVIGNHDAEPDITTETEKSFTEENKSRKNPVSDTSPVKVNEPVISQEEINKNETGNPGPVNKEDENKNPEQPEKAVRKISRILVFYNDRTFVEYTPGEE